MRFVLGHPHEDVFVQAALGDEMGREGRRLRAHLADCHACRARLQGVRQLRSHFLNTAVEAPREESLVRILQRRAAGERLLLADGDVTAPAPRDSRRSVTAMLMVTASIALAAIPA